jgi:NSS family neurotransmitter:Na+ symporter
VLSIACCILVVMCSLSVGNADIQLMGMPLMDFCDFLTAQIMLPAGALLTSILVGWVAQRQVVRNEFTNYETSPLKSLYPYYMTSARYVVPICILLILMHQFGMI